MSYDLGVFYTRRPHSDDDALVRYQAYCSDDFSRHIESSPRIEWFLLELRKHYPQDGEATGYIGYDCPWSADHDVSDGHVVMSVVHARAPEVVPVVSYLAEQHGLVCVDPQQAGVLTAPAGILVAETVATAEELEDDADRDDAALADVLDDLLEPRGFARRRRLWRKDDDNAVTTVLSGEEDGLLSLHFCIWFKPLGDVNPLKVEPEGAYHILHELCSDFIPEDEQFRLLRAFHFGADYADSVADRYGAKVAGYFEPREPLTIQWRAATLRRIVGEYVLPLFDRVDAGQYEALMAEQEAAREQERQVEWEQTLASWRPALAKCREWKEQGLDDGAIVERMREEIRDCASEAVLLCAAMGWTLDDTRQRMAAAGRKWTDLDEMFVDMFFEDEDMLKRHPDGRVELLVEEGKFRSEGR